jgi:hypothetical protein
MTTYTATYSGPAGSAAQAKQHALGAGAQVHVGWTHNPLTGGWDRVEEDFDSALSSYTDEESARAAGKGPESAAHVDSGEFTPDPGIGWVTVATDDLDATTRIMAEHGFALRLYGEVGQSRGASSLVI